MKALIAPERGKIELADIPEPVVGPYNALVRIEVCGICNSTDWKLIEGTMFWAPSFPLVLGHESVGVVVECGPRVRHFKVGDRVTRPLYNPPKEKTNLNPALGGFAEWGVVHDLKAMLEDGDHTLENDFNARRQLIVPKEVSPLEGALAISLSETASVLCHLPAVRGKNIVVAGTGGAGLSFSLWLKLAGARVIVLGRREERLKKALDLGADQTVNTKDPNWIEQIRQAANGPVEGMIEASGNADLAAQLVSLLTPDGFACAYGVPPKGVHYPAPWQEAVTEEFLVFDWVVDLLRRRWVQSEWFITHRWPFERAIEAFEQVRRGEVLKGFIEIG